MHQLDIISLGITKIDAAGAWGTSEIIQDKISYVVLPNGNVEDCAWLDLIG